MRAFCYASGLIAFGRTTPEGALGIASGPANELREFIETQARHGYTTKNVSGRLRKIPGTDCLLVPGVPESPDQRTKLDKLHAWLWWIGGHPPKGVTVFEPERPPLTEPQKRALLAARDEGGAVHACPGVRSRAGGAHHRMCRVTRPEVAGSTPAPRSNPWALSEAQAAGRDAAIARELARVAERCIVPGMPDDHIAFLLARRGFDAREWRRLRPLIAELTDG